MLVFDSAGPAGRLTRTFEDGHVTAMELLDALAPPMAPSREMREAATQGAVFVSVIRLWNGHTAIVSMNPLERSGDGRLGGVRSVIVEVDDDSPLPVAVALAVGSVGVSFQGDKYPELLKRVLASLANPGDRNGKLKTPSAGAKALVDALSLFFSEFTACWFLRVTADASLADIATALDGAHWEGASGVSVVAGVPEHTFQFASGLGGVVLVERPIDSAVLSMSTEVVVGIKPTGSDWIVERMQLSAVRDFAVGLDKRIARGRVEEFMHALDALSTEAETAGCSGSTIDAVTALDALAARERQPFAADPSVLAHELRRYALGEGDQWRVPELWLTDDAWVARAMLVGAIIRKVASTNLELRWALVSICLLGTWGPTVLAMVHGGGDLSSRLIDSVADKDLLPLQRARYGGRVIRSQRSFAFGLRYVDPAFHNVSRFLSSVPEYSDREIVAVLSQATRLCVPGLEAAVALGVAHVMGVDRLLTLGALTKGGDEQS